MRDLCSAALGAAVAAGADYADVRGVATRTQIVKTHNSAPVEISDKESEGIGVRVLVDGAWGFSSCRATGEAAAQAAALGAVAAARASAGAIRAPASLLERAPQIGSYSTPIELDPLEVSLGTKVELCLETEAAMRTSDVSTSIAGVWGQRERHLLLSSEGANLDQTVVKCGSDMIAVATRDGIAQKRSNTADHTQGGWEQVVAVDMPREGARLGEEAAALVRARPCPAGTTTVVLDHEALAVQLHESIGHPIELDRVFGMEAGYAGTSFLSTSDLHRRRVGSPRMNVTADTTTPGGLATIGYDDEGVPAERRPIIRDGVLRGFLDSRETAARLGEGAGGYMRAGSWNRVPLIRMANLHLDPGEGSLDELLADVDDGLYLVTNKSWSIDEKRLNFQFGVEVAWEVKRGKRTRMFRDAVYGGSTPTFWAGLDAVAGPEEWRLHGVLFCGKGQPGQHVHVSHGSPPARFKDVQVGFST